MVAQVTAEDPFTTRRKEYKSFRPNYLEFWDQLVSEAQDNETLVNDDPFEELINYITCFAQCAPRELPALVRLPVEANWLGYSLLWQACLHPSASRLFTHRLGVLPRRVERFEN